MSAHRTLQEISDSIDVVENHPKQGIIFRNIAKLLLNHDLTMSAMNYMAKLVKHLDIDYIVALESRGFLFAQTLAYLLSQGFEKKKGIGMIRKPNKLPNVISVSYGKEYGQDVLTIQEDMFPERSNILLVDDLIATGGSFNAGCQLVEKIGCNVVGCLSLIKLKGFELVEGLEKYKIFSLLEYPLNSVTKEISKEYATLFEEVKEYMPLTNVSVRDNRIIVFCHPSMRSMADSIISHSSDFRKGTIIWKNFPDGYYNVRFEELKYLENKRVVFFGSMYDPKVFMEQLSTILVLPRQRIRSLDIFFPYFGPGTMERVEIEGTLATAETFAHIISACQTSTKDGPPRLHIFDIHALPNRHYFNDNVIVCMESAIPLLKQKLGLDVTIVFPDDGAAKRFKADFENYTVIICAKDRVGNERHIRISDKHRWPTCKLMQIKRLQKCFILDDLVQSGETLRKCGDAIRSFYNQLLQDSDLNTEELTRFNKQYVGAYASHAVFPNRAYERFLTDETFDKFYVSNSNPMITDFLDGKGPFEVIKLDDHIRQNLLNSFGIMCTRNVSTKSFTALVASTNETKLSATYDALITVLSTKHMDFSLTVYGIGTCSNVSEQPVDDETITGCLNRLENLKRYVEHNNLKYDFLVSIENGVADLVEPYDFCNVAIEFEVDGSKSVKIHESFIRTSFPREYLEKSLNKSKKITVGKIIEEELGLAPETWHEHFDTKTSRHIMISSTIVDMFSKRVYISNVTQKRKMCFIENLVEPAVNNLKKIT